MTCGRQAEQDDDRDAPAPDRPEGLQHAPGRRPGDRRKRDEQAAAIALARLGHGENLPLQSTRMEPSLLAFLVAHSGHDHDSGPGYEWISYVVIAAGVLYAAYLLLIRRKKR